MEQRSNVQNRAEKEYKNSREKFYLLLREIISNSIQAVLIRKEKEKNASGSYIPEITLIINYSDKRCTIDLRDNGEGFTEINSQCFDELDRKNSEKERYHFHPLGQGRLAIVYFSDKANYETVYKDVNGVMRKKSFPYPKPDEGLFSLFEFDEGTSSADDTYTDLRIDIDKQNSLSRANTFFKKYSDIGLLKQWMVETFFPAIVANDDLVIKLILNGDVEKITRMSIEAETESLPFNMSFEEEGKFDFKLWLIKRSTPLKKDNPIVCFARYLIAELENGKLRYTLDSNEGYSLYLTSEYFDEHVDTKGEKIEISISDVAAINEKVNVLLDDYFKDIITRNQEESKRNLKNFKKRFPSLDAFIPEETVEENKGVMYEDDLVKTAIETKGKYEKKFWTQMSKPSSEDDDVPYEDTVECQKLLNSSLHIYVKHRERVLQRLHDMINPYDDDGELKPEMESDVQELLFKRGTLIDSKKNKNHLHNLWILDDKFTTFSSTMKAKSTKPGQEQADIYIWADDPDSVKQVLILELKSTTHAHNAGDSKEGMIAQVKRYAQDAYTKPEKILNWDEDMSNVQYQGVILARKKDIEKERKSNSGGGGYRRIPFLKSSFYKDDEFYVHGIDDGIPIRIELYSFEDIYKLASSRNDVFFRLLKNEFEVIEEKEEDKQQETGRQVPVS